MDLHPPPPRAERVRGRLYARPEAPRKWLGREWACEHGVQKSRCKKCGGAGICPCGKQRRFCKTCGGSALCPHGRQRYVCQACGGASVCVHGIRRPECRLCAANPSPATQSCANIDK